MRESARSIAIQALVRVEEGAYANLVLPGLLERSSLSQRDRAFATELTYGTIRMQRACDWMVTQHLSRPLEKLDPPVLAALRVGAYQLVFAKTPAHAAVGETVGLVQKSTRGLVNAVLRKVASTEPAWPDDPTRLSYPNWIVDRLRADLGDGRALAALEQMNQPAMVTERADGYVQDTASQLVAATVTMQPGDRTLDLCAAPGGKATAIANEGGIVIAADHNHRRSRLVAENVERLRLSNVNVVQADGRRPPFRPGSFDRVLVDAPCSGLGVLRRRPDARWRIQESDVDDLVRLQRELLAGAAELVASGGTLVYSVCTLTIAETSDVIAGFDTAHPEFEQIDSPRSPWESIVGGARLLPQTAGTDGMYLAMRRRAATG